MLQGITIASLFSSLLSYGHLFVIIVLLYLVMRVSSAFLVWVWRTLIVPIFEKRAYFYRYNSAGVFYKETPFLGFIRLGRNFRSRINDTVVGYIATKRGQKNENPGANKIFLRRKGREFIGEAKSKYEYGRDENGRTTWKNYTNHRGETICNIYLTNPDEEGGYEVNDNPVGYVDKTGRIFKYYASREDWINRVVLPEPCFVGQCETPSSKSGKRDDTEGERSDADVLKYIKWKANQSRFSRSENETESSFSVEEIGERRTYLDTDQNFQMDDRWFFFRRNCPFFKKVKSKEMTDGGAVSDGKRFPYAFLSAKLWRILHVYPSGWPCKAKAWGYGYCTENFRNPFIEGDDDFPMITRAAAALLLAEKEGFYPGSDEAVSDGVPGAVATALISLFIYIFLFPLLTKLSSYLLFPFLGLEYGQTVTLIGYYFVIWLCIVNPIRVLIRYHHDWLEAFLELLNRNVGVLGWMSTLVASTAIGLFGSLFMYGIDYTLFPLFFSALVAVLFNWAFYHQKSWGISSIHEDFSYDESEHDEFKENENPTDENTEKIRHEATLSLPTQRIAFDETILFDKEKLVALRLENQFRKESLSESYESTVKNMIYREFNGEVYSKILYMRKRIGYYVNKYRLSNIEKVKLILRICQPNNIEYEYDENCKELYEGIDEGRNKGFYEYCRFPTETIHDRRGDCDCHAAFGAALLAACGFRSCFVIGGVQTSDGTTDHAMCGIECTDELNVYRKPNNSINVDGKTFIILETVGRYNIDEVMEYQENMVRNHRYCSVIEPYKQTDKQN